MSTSNNMYTFYFIMWLISGTGLKHDCHFWGGFFEDPYASPSSIPTVKNNNNYPICCCCHLFWLHNLLLLTIILKFMIKWKFSHIVTYSQVKELLKRIRCRAWTWFYPLVVEWMEAMQSKCEEWFKWNKWLAKSGIRLHYLQNYLKNV